MFLSLCCNHLKNRSWKHHATRRKWTDRRDYHAGKSVAKTKEELLLLWDRVTIVLYTFWPEIPNQRFQEIVLAFGEYEGYATDVILYWIDNEIHHRAQGYVYLRSLGIEPPAFWNRD